MPTLSLPMPIRLPILARDGSIQTVDVIPAGDSSVDGHRWVVLVVPDELHTPVALSLEAEMAEAAEDKPLLCLVDDAQWLDEASAQVLAFVARRVGAERLAMVFAVRSPHPVQELDGLPQLVIEGLGSADDTRSWIRELSDILLEPPAVVVRPASPAAEPRGK